ncbi:hypothetical protein BDR26DRAFT_818625 [Obelidium mucronatum]|nr:hypothetical protein BDR26DRAFT_818625 [Obelidium mucronatum]
MDLVHSNLFVDSEAESESDKSVLTSGDRHDLSCIFFYLCIIQHKDVHNRSLVLMEDISKFLSLRPQEISCHPPLLSTFCHLLHLELCNSSADVIAIMRNLFPSLISIWTRSQFRDAFYRPGSHRSSILQLFRIYFLMGTLPFLNSTNINPICLDYAIIFEQEEISAIYQAAIKELQSKRSNILCLSEPSLLLTALSSSYLLSTPFLNLQHATEFISLDDSDCGDRAISTWLYIDMLSDVVFHSAANNHVKSTCPEEEEPSDSSRKRRKISNTQTAISDFLLQLKNANASSNHRNVILQTSILLFQKMKLFSGCSTTVDLAGFQESLCSLLSSDSENPWVYICLGCLVGVGGASSLGWERVFEMCDRKFEASRCEASFFLLSRLSIDLKHPGSSTALSVYFSSGIFQKDHQVSSSVCRFIIESEGVPAGVTTKKQARDIVAALIQRCSVVSTNYVAQAVVKLVTGVAPRPKEGGSTKREFGFWPVHILPTETILEEWRFLELKKSVSVAFLESYELLIPVPTVINKPKDVLGKTEVSWLIKELSDCLDRSMGHSLVNDLLHSIFICHEICGFIFREAPSFRDMFESSCLVSKLDASIALVVQSLQSNQYQIDGIQLEDLKLLFHIFQGGSSTGSSIFSKPSISVVISALSTTLKLYLTEFNRRDAFSDLSSYPSSSSEMSGFDHNSQQSHVVKLETNDFEVKGDDTQSDECFPGNLMYLSHYDVPAGRAARVDKIMLKKLLVVETLSNLHTIMGCWNTGNLFFEFAAETLGGFVFAGDLCKSVECTASQVTKVLDEVESRLRLFNDEKNQWTWLEICRVLRVIAPSVFVLSDGEQLGFMVQLLAFFASELQKGQVVWQLYVEFGSLMKEVLIHDHEYRFLLSDPDTLFFSSPKGQTMTPLPFVSHLCHHDCFQIRVFSSLRLKSLLGLSNIKNKLVADLSANSNTSGLVVLLPKDTIVLLVFCLEDRMENRELLYHFLSKCSDKAIEFASRIACSSSGGGGGGGGSEGDGAVDRNRQTSHFLNNAAQMLARSLAANSRTFADAIQLLDGIPLSKCGSTTAEFLNRFSGYFTANFLLKRNYDSVDELCQFLNLSRGDLIVQGFDIVVGTLFSMAQASEVANWCTNELGGNDKFTLFLKHRTQAIICEIICNFDCNAAAGTPAENLFKNDPLMKFMFLNLFGDQVGGVSVPSNRISIHTALEILETIAALFEAENISSLVTKWDVFSLIQLVNEYLEGIVIQAERERTAKSSIGILLILSSTAYSTPLLLQMLLSLVFKFLSCDYVFLSKAISAVMHCAQVTNKLQALSIAKVIYTVAVKAEEFSMTFSTKNWFLESLSFLLQSLNEFQDVQRLSIIFIDVSNPIFDGLFKVYGWLFSPTLDYSVLIEEAIECAIPGAEIAIVKFIRYCLNTGKDIVVLSGVVSFLTRVVMSKAVEVSEQCKVLATQCLAMLLVDIPDDSTLESMSSRQESVLSLLTACLEDLSPRILQAATAAIVCVLRIDDGSFWPTCVTEGTSAWKAFEFFKENGAAIAAAARGPEVAGKFSKVVDLNLWRSFEVSCVCQNLVLAFETDELFNALYDMLGIVPKMAVAVFPMLVHNILLKEKRAKTLPAAARTALSKGFNMFLDDLDKQSFASILSIIETLSYLRTQVTERNFSTFSADYWLDIDYRKAAKAAMKVKNRTLGLMFYELSMTEKSHGNKSTEDLDLLLEIYRVLDYDAVDGVIGCRELTGDNIGEVYVQSKEFTKSLILQNAELMSSSLLGGSAIDLPSNTRKGGLSEPLSQLGCYHGVLKTIVDDPNLIDLHYESLWRCGMWDVIPKDGSKCSGLNYYIFNAGRSFALSDPQSAGNHLQEGFLYLASSLDLIDITRSLNIQSRLLPAMKLLELQAVANLQENFDLKTAKKVFQSWDEKVEALLPKIHFDDLESVISSRIVGLVSMLKLSPPQSEGFLIVHEYLCKTLLMYSKRSRKSGKLQCATIAMSILKALNNPCTTTNSTAITSTTVNIASEFEDFKVLYRQGNATLAIRKLKSAVASVSTSSMRSSNLVAAELYGKLAKWSYLQRSESPQCILEYFNQSSHHALAMVNSVEVGDSSRGGGGGGGGGRTSVKLSSCFYHFASFADKTYTQMSLDESHEQMKLLIEERQLELDALNARLKLKPDDTAVKNSFRRLNNQIRFDRMELHRYGKEVEKFLIQSIENYFLCLMTGDKWDICVFRICALWFSNSQIPKVNTLVAKYLALLMENNRKFLPLIYQLSARMATNEDDFQHNLKRLLSGMITSHPYHTVYQLIALKNGADSKPPNLKALNIAALDLLNRLKSSNANLGRIIQTADELCDAYIDLAFQAPPASSRKARIVAPVPIDKRSKLGKISNLSIPILTVDHAVSLSCDYSSVPTIAAFDREYTLVGGINAPKVLNCTGSDGVVYKQLVKGGSDDLRQDATLSNVFGIMNILLGKNFETRRRGLFIETYKVVPLGQRAGVLEWVDNTVPFGEYLGVAHERYYKDDMKSLDARRKMMLEHERVDSTPESKLQVFKEIAAKYRPVFRHFFFESFRDPAMWVKCRTSYTRSTAVTSILSWIIGLGDRHPQNTLIHKLTGSIVQIDLGIAFDQGKLLSTPELVPFRLTRDVIDAMGSTGIEGPFRRCCEETLKVARKEAEVIYTILDVFRYDPLYNWKGAQSRSSDGVLAGKNMEAERALVGVKKKLSDKLSIECQTNELLLCAMSEENLSKMYPGWQPWM